MGHGDLLFHITVGGLGCRAPGGQPGRRAGHPGAPRSGRRTRLVGLAKCDVDTTSDEAIRAFIPNLAWSSYAS